MELLPSTLEDAGLDCDPGSIDYNGMLDAISFLGSPGFHLGFNVGQGLHIGGEGDDVRNRAQREG